jgi:hypothetical protein
MCTLRVYGTDFDVEAFLAASSLIPSTIFRKGEPRWPESRPDGPKQERSGVCIGVSDADWSNLPAQVSDAEKFLIAHQETLEALAGLPGIEDFVLDFPIELRADGVRLATQTDQFPSSLVRLAGALGLGLALTLYS